VRRRTLRHSGRYFFQPLFSSTAAKTPPSCSRRPSPHPAHRHLQNLDEPWLRQRLRVRLTSSIYTRSLDVAMRASNELKFGETYVNRENFEAMQGFHAGWRKSGIEAPTASTP